MMPPKRIEASERKQTGKQAARWLPTRYPDPDRLDSVSVAWSAGFLEGEGTFWVNGYSFMISATQVNPEPLQRLQEMYGGSLALQKNDPEIRNSVWRWHMFGAPAKRVVRLIAPFLSQTKLSSIPKEALGWDLVT